MNMNRQNRLRNISVKGVGLSKVLKSLDNDQVLKLGKDKDELSMSIHAKELGPYTPNPGDKSKSLNKEAPSETIFEVLK